MGPSLQADVCHDAWWGYGFDCAAPPLHVRDQSEVTEEELEATREMEREARSRDLAEQEFVAYQDSQEQSQRVVQPDRGRIQVCLQGSVDSGPASSLVWSMSPGQCFRLQLRLDPNEPDRATVATQVAVPSQHVATQTEAECRGVKRRLSSDVDQGPGLGMDGVNADLGGEGLPAGRGRHEGDAGHGDHGVGEPAAASCDPVLSGGGERGHKWGSMLKRSTAVIIEDSQLAE